MTNPPFSEVTYQKLCMSCLELYQVKEKVPLGVTTVNIPQPGQLRGICRRCIRCPECEERQATMAFFAIPSRPWSVHLCAACGHRWQGPHHIPDNVPDSLEE